METTLAQQVQEELEEVRRRLRMCNAMLHSMGLDQEALACQGTDLDVGYLMDGLRALGGKPTKRFARATVPDAAYHACINSIEKFTPQLGGERRARKGK